MCGFSLRAKFKDGDVREREPTPEVSDLDEAGAVRRGWSGAPAARWPEAARRVVVDDVEAFPAEVFKMLYDEK